MLTLQGDTLSRSAPIGKGDQSPSPVSANSNISANSSKSNYASNNSPFLDQFRKIPFQKVKNSIFQKRDPLNDYQIYLNFASEFEVHIEFPIANLDQLPVQQACTERKRDNHKALVKWIKANIPFLRSHVQVCDQLRKKSEISQKSLKLQAKKMSQFVNERVQKIELVFGKNSTNLSETVPFEINRFHQKFLIMDEEISRKENAYLEQARLVKQKANDQITLPFENAYKEIQTLKHNLRAHRLIICDILDGLNQKSKDYMSSNFEICRSIINRKKPTTDSFLFFCSIKNLMESLVNEQREYGRLAYEITVSIRNIQQTILKCFKEIVLSNLFGPSVFAIQNPTLEKQFSILDVNYELEQIYKWETLIGSEFIHQYCQNPTDQLIRDFLAVFKVQELDNCDQLILKNFQLQREDASYNFVKSDCKVTADGYILFYDINQHEPECILNIEGLKIRKSRRKNIENEIHVLEYHSGFLGFRKSQQVRVCFNDRTDLEALQMVLKHMSAQEFLLTPKA